MVTIGGKTFWVDSNQEEALIRWLEENGFRGKWRRPEYGIQVGVYRYTPDAEVAVLMNNDMTTRVIVESKPTLKHLSAAAKLRIRKTAKFYCTDLILLYVHDSNTWYRVDIKTGALLHYGIPKPGIKLIDDMFMPKTRYGSKAWDHEYVQRLELGKRTLLYSLKLIEDGVKAFALALVTPPKAKKKRGRRRKLKPLI